MENDDLFLENYAPELKEFIIQGKEEKIVEEINRLIGLYPDRKDVLFYMLGQYYMLAKDGTRSSYLKAIKVYKELLELKKASSKYLSHAITNIAFAYREIGDLENAIKYFKRKFDEFPNEYDNNSDLYIKLRNIYNDLLAQKGQ